MEGGVGGGGGGGGLPGRCKAGRASGDEGSHWCQAGAGYLFVWGSWEYWKHLLADKELMLSNTLQCRRCVCFVSRATFSTPDVVRLIVGREGVHSDAHIIFFIHELRERFLNADIFDSVTSRHSAGGHACEAGRTRTLPGSLAGGRYWVKYK